MDACGIGNTMLSVSSPGVVFGDDGAAQALTRQVNETGAEAVRDEPGRFGLFASLPLPNIDAALAEIAYSLDELQADAVVLMSNYHGTYLGDPALEPVFKELARRRAVVFVHPTSPVCAACSALPVGISSPVPFSYRRTISWASGALGSTGSYGTLRSDESRVCVPGTSGRSSTCV
jgi:predicted TIM-barrel fold metal-dependent hydrolase